MPALYELALFAHPQKTGALPSFAALLLFASGAGAESATDSQPPSAAGADSQPGRAASAEPRPGDEVPCDRDGGRRALAISASVVPGVLVHGSGQWPLCRKQLARTLLAGEGIGVAAAAASASGLAVTGASRYLVAPLAVGLLGGASLFALTWLADIYAAAAPEGGLGSRPKRAPKMTIRTGLTWVDDRQFNYGLFVTHGFDLDLRWLWVSPEFDVALDANNRRYSVLAGHRLLGANPAKGKAPGVDLDLVGGLTDHAYADEGFSMTIAELKGRGRLALGAIDPHLRGAFADAELGYARQWSRFRGFPDNYSDELLARAAFGVYLGRGDPIEGEALLAYDHRRDTLAGGLRTKGIGAGYLGFIQQRTQLYFGKLGVGTELDLGAALVFSTLLLVRLGS